MVVGQMWMEARVMLMKYIYIKLNVQQQTGDTE